MIFDSFTLLFRYSSSVRDLCSAALALLALCSLSVTASAGSDAAQVDAIEPPANSQATAEAGAANTESVSADGAYFRLMPPGRTTSAAFLLLHNRGSEAQTLQSLSSPSVERVELHEHSHADGMMRMRKIDEITIAAGDTLELKPGGYHIMLFGMPTGLTVDDSLEITLGFASGETLTVVANARSLK